jgi:hypothetical protein
MTKSMAPPLLFDLRGKRVYVAGHTGLAGRHSAASSAISESEPRPPGTGSGGAGRDRKLINRACRMQFFLLPRVGD